jgi:hypothetical protein
MVKNTISAREAGQINRKRIGSSGESGESG